MPATFVFSEANYVDETITDDIANLNFGSIDDPEITPADNPIPKGQNSFQKYLKAYFSDTFAEISNMKFWMSIGVLLTGEAIVGINNVAFAEPSRTKDGGDGAIPITEGTAWAIQAEDGSSTIIAEGYTKYIRVQETTTILTPAGAANQKTFTFQYDEI